MLHMHTTEVMQRDKELEKKNHSEGKMRRLKRKKGNGEQERGIERERKEKVFSSKWVTLSCRLSSSSNLHGPLEI